MPLDGCAATSLDCMSVPAFRASAVRAAEQPHLDAGRGDALMRRAAAGLATVCRQALVESRGRVTGSRVVALVGPGNNGGDALFAAADLARRGASVIALAPWGRAHAAGLQAARRAGIRIDLTPADDAVEALSAADLVLDGLLGTGARPQLEGAPAQLLRAWTTARSRLAGPPARPRPLVIAVDVPTGVDATTGECDPLHLRADRTVTFGLHKAGLHLPGGAEAAGRLHLVDLGLDPQDAGEPPAARVVRAGDLADWPQPGPRSHKYTRGVLGVIAGSAQYPGAGVLTCLAAAGVGVGMLRVLGARTVQDAVLAQLPEAVTAPGRVQAWVLGPGAPDPQDMMEFLAEAVGTAAPLVLDAGALALIPALLTAAGGGPAQGGPSPLPAATVLTPHAGELTALLTRIDTDTEDLAREDAEQDPARWARRAAHLTGAVVLLKGPRTIIAVPDGRLWLPAPGPATLATAGSGDVLAGLVGAALATGMSDAVDEDPADAAAHLAALAVVLHNQAGLRARSASALAQAVPEVLSSCPSTRLSFHSSSSGGHLDAR